MDTDDLDSALEDIERTLADLEAVLEGEGEAASAIADYLAADGSLEDDVQTFLDWANANTDADINAIQSAAADYLNDSGAGGLDETPVSDFQTYLQSQGESESQSGEGGQGTDDSEDPNVDSDEAQVTMEDLDQVKDVVGQVSTALGDIKDLLTAREDQREEELSDLKRRLSELEDEPVKRSLAGEQSNGDFYESEEGEPAPAGGVGNRPDIMD